MLVSIVVEIKPCVCDGCGVEAQAKILQVEHPYVRGFATGDGAYRAISTLPPDGWSSHSCCSSCHVVTVPRETVASRG